MSELEARSRELFKERLLAVMERKEHWAAPLFAGGGLSREGLRIHLMQEYATYVRDFPILIARVLGNEPPLGSRRAFAENLYEEATGGLVAGKPHPELFLYMVEGLGLDPRAFEAVELLPAAAEYRAWLDEATRARPWWRGAVVATVFVEGTKNERADLEREERATAETGGPAAASEADVQAALAKHPLVVHHGLDPRYLALSAAHRRVEGTHRRDAWAVLLDHVRDPSARREVVYAAERSLELWLAYRDGVAAACGLVRPPRSGRTEAA
jgi:pyrroloquinoline-quinone synthase